MVLLESSWVAGCPLPSGVEEVVGAVEREADMTSIIVHRGQYWLQSKQSTLESKVCLGSNAFRML